MATKKTKAKASKLDELLECKFAEYNLGTLEIKEKLAASLEVFKNDKKLLSMIVTGALEDYGIYNLANEYKKRFKSEENFDELEGKKDESNSV